MELKLLYILHVYVCTRGFNRTFMELKPFWTMYNCCNSLCFNRTFMELKLRIDSLQNLYDAVLIVPLWNWNVISSIFILNPRNVLIVPLWNWNSIAISLQIEIMCFNRTFMELKLIYLIREDFWLYVVLIVPLWNWNR